ncbi:hypothetical protein G7K_0806-t1 [Saitoella complicata NRRL Y-17804]|uniref:Uncharacterized protein n=1 Tax=Saitoella complicata (strain BCRC 22490 / CBS 7301 / JCM 7358 / NBRC 10748 / NRRL Y-17804) TaxID=698492 RepID=A0A0E9N9L0_SAICN|nr:hypothetical protein G7K_0806-t1 [Saitoella complicata NRRL Y-17804]
MGRASRACPTSELAPELRYPKFRVLNARQGSSTQLPLPLPHLIPRLRGPIILLYYESCPTPVRTDSRLPFPSSFED